MDGRLVRVIKKKRITICTNLTLSREKGRYMMFYSTCAQLFNFFVVLSTSYMYIFTIFNNNNLIVIAQNILYCVILNLYLFQSTMITDASLPSIMYGLFCLKKGRILITMTCIRQNG